MEQEVKFVYTLDHSDVTNKAKDIKQEIHQNAKEVEKLGVTTDEFVKTVNELMSAFGKLTTAVDKNTEAQKKTGEAGKEAAEKEKKGADEATKSIHRTKEEADSLSGSFGKLTKYAAGFFTLQAAQGFIKKVFDVRSEIQSLHTSFETLVGDKGKADALFNSIKEFAVSTPMQMKDLASAAQTMMSFNIPVEQVMENLKAIGDVSMGDAQKFQSLSLAFSQMSATGKLMGQDLLQMINAGFNPLATMSEKTGKSIGELKDEMSKGAISADMVRQAFIDATSEGGKFHGMLEAQSKTLRGAYSNLQGAIDDALNGIGERTEGVFKSAIEAATFLVAHYEEVVKILGVVASTYGTYKAAVMAVTAVEQVQALSRLAHIKGMTLLHLATDLLTKKTAALNATMLANPYVLCATAIAGLVSALVLFTKHTDSAADSQRKINETFAQTQAEIASEQKKIDELFDTLRNAKKGTDAYKSAKDNILSQYGHYLNGLSREVSSLQNVEAAYKAVSRAARDAAMARGMEAAMHGAQDSYNETYSKNYDKIRGALAKAWGEERASEWMDALQNDLRRNGKISDKNKEIIKDYFRGSSTYGNMETWISDLNRNEQTFDEARKRAEEKFGPQKEKKKDKSKEEIVRNKKVIEAQRDAAQLELDALKDIDAAGEKGRKLREKISGYNKELEAYSAKSDSKAAAAASKSAREERKQAKEESVRNARQIQEELRYQEEFHKIRQQAIDARTDADIALISKSSDRERAEQDEQHRRNLRQIDDQADEMRKALYEHNKKVWENSHKDGHYELTDEGKSGWTGLQLSEDQQAYIRAQLDKENAEYKRYLDERKKQDRSQLYSYLKEYGGIQEKKAAIAKEYDEQIAETSSVIEKATLEEKKKRELQALDMESMKLDIDWETVFNDMDRVPTDALKRLRDKLRKALQDGSLDPDNAKVISEKLLEAENEIASRTNVYANMIPALQERVRLTNSAKVAEEELAAATKTAAEKEEEYRKQQEKIISTLEGFVTSDDGSTIDTSSLRAGQITVNMLDEIATMFGIDEGSDKYNLLKEEFDRLAVSSANLGAAQDETTEAMNRASNANRMLSGFKGEGFIGGINDIFSEAIKKGGGDVMGTISLVNSNIQSLPELIDTIGISNTEFGEAVGEFAEGTSQFMNAIQSFASGDIVGGVTGIIKGFQSYGRMLGIGGGNAAEINRAHDRLADRNQILTDAIDRLNDTMGKQTGINAIETYKELVKLQKELEENLQEQLRLQMQYHEAHHSFNKEWGGVSAEQLAQFNKLHGTSWNGDLSSLTAEEAAAIMSDVNLREMIKSTGKGGYGERVLEWISQLAEQAGKTKEATDALYASLTAGTTRESVYSDFLNDLYDLANGSEDVMDNIAKNWQQMVNKMVINNLIGSKMQKELEAWYEALGKLNEERSKAGSAMTDDEYFSRLEELQKRYEGFVTTAQGEIDDLTKMGIIKPIDDAASTSLLTLDTIRDGWRNMLMDMSQSTDDWANDIARIMAQALIEDEILNAQWKEQQEEWLARYKEAMEDQSLTDAQRQALLRGLQEEQEDWIESNRTRARQIMEMTGYDADGRSEQSATVQAMERITVDQADELIGRMNAGQIIWEQQRALTQQIQQNMQSMYELVNGSVGRGVNDLVSLAVTRNQHLTNILTACQTIHTDMTSEMEDMKRIMNEKL